MSAAAQGTRCWANRCVDYVGPVTNAEPFFLPIGASYMVRIDGPQPTKVGQLWTRAPAEVPVADGGMRTWSMPPDPGVGSGQPSRAPATPGDYLLLVEAFWPGGRDISYGFYVSLR